LQRIGIHHVRCEMLFSSMITVEAQFLGKLTDFDDPMQGFAR